MDFLIKSDTDARSGGMEFWVMEESMVTVVDSLMAKGVGGGERLCSSSELPEACVY